MSKIVAIIGASEKKNRYSNMAMWSLLENGYEVRLVNPFKTNIEGYECLKSLNDIKEKIDTVTVYVNPTRLKDHIEALVKSKPNRVIMNPGAEDYDIGNVLINTGIKVQYACTLVLLSSGKF